MICLYIWGHESICFTGYVITDDWWNTLLLNSQIDFIFYLENIFKFTLTWNPSYWLLSASNWCRYTDKNLDSCWKHSLNHHASELLHKVENLYSSLLHVDHWKRSNLDDDDPELGGQDFERGVLEEVLSSWESDDESKVNKTVMRRVFNVVFEEVSLASNAFVMFNNDEHTLYLSSCL